MNQIKSIILFAIIPALIAGLFSIAPKLYDIAVEPKAGLSYSITSSPDIETDGKYRRIYSIQINNHGKRSLSNIQAQLNIDKGIIEKFKLSHVSSLRPKILESKQSISIDIKNLHPNENFTISTLLLLTNNQIYPIFNLRSNEVLGLLKKPKLDNIKASKTALISTLLVSLSVFLMAILVTKRPKILLTILGHSLIKSISFNGKQDSMFYIIVRLGLQNLSDDIKLLDNNITYLRIADILLAVGLTGTKEEKKKSIKALKCLLIAQEIADISKQVIFSNIKTLEQENYSKEEMALLEKVSIDVTNLIEFRTCVENYIKNDLSFLKSYKVKPNK